MNAPPKWITRFLHWYCNPAILEEVEGDLLELYDRRTAGSSLSYANRKYLWDVIRFFRWSNIKRTNSKYTMDNTILFRSYLKMGFRNLKRYWVTATINILGLALAIGLGITIFIFIDMQLNMDTYHTKADRIYQITNYVKEENQESNWSDTPIQLGPQLLQDHPVIEDFARIEYSNANVRYGDEVFSEFFIFTDPGYFKMFDFPMLYGNRDVLERKDQVVISYEMAVKYFDNEDPVGKELSFKFDNGQIRRFSVGAVLDKYPDNSSFGFRFHLPMEVFFDIYPKHRNSWEYLTDGTFLLARDQGEIENIRSSFDQYVTVQNGFDPEWKVTQFEIFSLIGLSQVSFDIVSSISNGSHPAGRIALGMISMMILVLACFNYMNISVAAATKRLKEIGLRKVMGGKRKQIITQFMIENAVQCLLALGLGVLISYFLILPLFNAMIPIHIPFEFSSFPMMVGFFVSLLVLIGVISGAYPALFISKFLPTHIFRGDQRLGGKNLFSKILLGFQFVFAFTTIVGSFVFTENAIFLRHRDWGYDPAGILSIEVQNSDQAELLIAGLSEHPEVQSISKSQGHISRYNRYTNYYKLGEELQGVVMQVDGQYFNTLNLPLVEGRVLTDNAVDQSTSAVVNETFVTKMGWEDPIGESFDYDSLRRTVVGVVKDFHYSDFYRDIEAMFFVGLGDSKANYVSVRTSPERMMDFDDYAKESWFEIAPNDPYDREFQEDAFDDFYEENRANITLMMLICGITIILATLGLYGLFLFNIQKRIKEFSVHKVLGAAPINIIRIASRQYFWVILISFVIGAPLGYITISQLVTTIYPDPKVAGPWPFVVSILIVLITISVTISGQIMRATKLNPAENLRSE